MGARRAVLLLFAVAGCARTTPVVTAPASPAPPAGRLPDGVRPLRAALSLGVFPERDTFDGAIDIDLDLRASTSIVWLHARELTVLRAELTVGGATLPARVVAGGARFLGFATGHPVGPGPARLRVEYRGPLRASAEGFFHAREGDAWYAATNFEPLGARRAFPCFDEPSFKIPWRVTLRVPRGDVALANMPVASERELPDGTKEVAFAESPPLPSYLVAVTVGPFDLVDGGRAGRQGTPIRIAVPRGRGADASLAAEYAPRLLERLEAWFDVPFPYPKLDQVAVPGMTHAMENAGLITYRPSMLLLEPARATPTRRRFLAYLMAHEVSHHWFGDLVTMAWWDDLWLSEAFADWIAEKVVDAWQPSWDLWSMRVSWRGEAFATDALVAAPRVRRVIAREDDVLSAFDSITYQKGAAVLGMFERWVGDEVFRRGLGRHLAAHAHGNATAEDLFAALAAASGRPVAQPMSTFLDPGGLPVVSVGVRCDGAGARVMLSQRRHLAIGAVAPSETRWRIPLCVAWGDGGGSGRECTLLEEARGAIALPRCPSWVVPTQGEARYFHVAYEGDLALRALEHMAPVERMGLAGDIDAGYASGALAAPDALALLARLARDENGHVAAATVAVAGRMSRSALPDERRDDWAGFVRDTWGPRARALGWAQQASDGMATRWLRDAVVGFVVDEGGDEALVAEAGRLAARWLADRAAVDPDLAPRVLRIAASRGDSALFERIRAAAVASPAGRDRDALMRGLGSFHAPALLEKALAMTLGDEIPPLDRATVLFAAHGHRSTRPAAWRFVRAHVDELATRLPEAWAAYLPKMGTGLCDAAGREQVDVLFRPRLARMPGAAQPLAETLETIQQCAAVRATQGAALVKFLATRAQGPR